MRVAKVVVLSLVLIFGIEPNCCFAQLGSIIEADSLLSVFYDELKSDYKLNKSNANYSSIMASWKSRYLNTTSTCSDSILFYKVCARFSSSYPYDDSLSLSIQRDTVLPLQSRCLGNTHLSIITTYFNIAESYRYLKNYEEAENYYLRVVEAQTSSDTLLSSFSYHYYFIGAFYEISYVDMAKAEVYYKRSIADYIGDKNDLKYVTALQGIGRIAFEKGDFNSAIKAYDEAIELDDQFDLIKLDNRSILHEELALAYREQELFSKAIKHIKKAINISVSRGERGLEDWYRQSRKYANILKSAKEYPEAVKILLDVEKQQNGLGSSISIFQLAGLQEDIADVYFEMGKLETALERYQNAININLGQNILDIYSNPIIVGQRIFSSEHLRRRIGLKVNAFNKLVSAGPSEILDKAIIDGVFKYDTLNQYLLQEKREEGSFKKQMNSAILVYSQGIDACLRAYGRTKDKSHLQNALTFSSKFKAQLLERGIRKVENKNLVLSDSLKKEEKALKKSMSKAEKAYVNSILVGNKDEAAINFKTFSDLKFSIDKFNLDNGLDVSNREVYDRTANNIELWTQQAKQGEAILEYYVSTDSIYSFLLIDGDIHFNVSTYNKLEVEKYFSSLSSGGSIIKQQALSAKILDVLLPYMDSITSLTIIPDGFLLSLPFEALQLESGSYLVEKLNISYSYSFNFLAPEQKSTAKNFLGVAIDYDSKELREDTIWEGRVPSALLFAIDEVEKANAISGGIVLKNEEATISNFYNSLDEKDILHFAMHSRLEEDYPDQSSLIFYSDSSDYFLTASEIYDLEIDADLTVLSACNTAVGEFNVGDGVRSLTRSFIHAGSKSVLTSLWESIDVSTNKIVEDFYINIKEGLPKDQALRTAKLNFLQNAHPSQRHPKYWAHLIIVGDTSPMEFVSSSWRSWALGAAALIGILLLFYFFKKTK